MGALTRTVKTAYNQLFLAFLSFSSSSTMAKEPKKRTIRDKPAPYDRQKKVGRPSGSKNTANMPKTSAVPVAKARRQRLTTWDWIQVYEFVDAHPDMTQAQIVEHFANRKVGGCLYFDQSTLSKNTKPAA